MLLYKFSGHYGTIFLMIQRNTRKSKIFVININHLADFLKYLLHEMFLIVNNEKS